MLKRRLLLSLKKILTNTCLPLHLGLFLQRKGNLTAITQIYPQVGFQTYSPIWRNLINWKYHNIDCHLRLCVTISDGTHATKQARISEEFAEMITEAPLYSIITVNSGNIYNGCIFGIDDFEITRADIIQPILKCQKLTLLDRDYFENLFRGKRMINEDVQVDEHPRFNFTPVVMRTRTRTNVEKTTGGFKCDGCQNNDNLWTT